MESVHIHPATAGTVLLFVPLLFVAGLLLVYLVAAQRQRRLTGQWSGWRILSMVLGAALLAIALSPPLKAIAHQDLRGHMIQHLLIGMFAPLGLVFAAPVPLALRTLPPRSARFVIAVLHRWPCHWLLHPIAALIVNSGGMYLLYLTPLYTLTSTYPYLHDLMHIHFLAAGWIFTWVVVAPDPMPHRPRLHTRLGVLFISIAAHAHLSKLMYVYLLPAHTSHSADEIRAAAQLMYYGGDLAELWLVIAFFAVWYRQRGRRSSQSLTAERAPARLDTNFTKRRSAARGVRT
jgi:putative membrane protein